ncbi:MAG TPA: hypothetical protein VLB76_20105 [Thermoanaerobaculia bacterium]|jgi:hypothetical protein|nr:hypothetical protein [Thermoanaerobaculia bacterium]
MKTSRRELLAMAVLAVGLRVVLFAVATGLTGTTFSDYARAADGYQYIANARAWLGPDAEFAAHPLFGRFFPGYPLLMAGLHLLGIPFAAAALLPSWLAAGAVAVLCALYFKDRRVGWAMAALTPSYVFSGSLICSEVMCLLGSIAGLQLARKDKSLAAGVAFGLGGLFRPVAVFAMFGAVAADLLAERRLRRPTILTAAAGLTVAAGLAAVQWRFGDALMSVRQYTGAAAYGDHLTTWPFKALITIPLTSHVPAWKLAFVAAHLIAVLGGCALAVRQWLRAAGPERYLAAVAGVWLLANTLYVVSIGGFWGFHDFPRFLVPALPPLFFVYRRILPARLWAWPAFGALSVILSIEPTTRRLDPAPAPAPAAEATWQIPGVRPSAS